MKRKHLIAFYTVVTGIGVVTAHHDHAYPVLGMYEYWHSVMHTFFTAANGVWLGMLLNMELKGR